VGVNTTRTMREIIAAQSEDWRHNRSGYAGPGGKWYVGGYAAHRSWPLTA
jgi:hypothetical protein